MLRGVPILTSLASAIAAPAPAQTPSIAATIGCGQCRIDFTRSPVMRVKARMSPVSRLVHLDERPMISWTSPPDEKFSPAP